MPASKATCETCGGCGSLSCWGCCGSGFGRGWRPDDHGPHVACGLCGGSGDVFCDTCDGTGEVEREIPVLGKVGDRGRITFFGSEP